MQKMLLTLIMMFTVMLGLGLSFMEYRMFSPTLNLIMIIIGILGAFITGFKFCKKAENIRKKRNDTKEVQLDAIRKVAHSIKLKDSGVDIDEEIEILKKNDIKIKCNNKIN